MKLRLFIRRLLSVTLTDKSYLKVVYYLTFKRKLNISNPIYWTEKIQVKKLYDRNSKLTLVADKVKVRKFVKEKLHKDIMPHLIWTGKDPEQIPFERLPESFVIKTNHGTGTNIIVREKKNINKEEVISQLKEWLKKDFYKPEKEWAYKNIERKILIEELYVGEGNDLPKDIKLYMFKGTLGAINIHDDRFGDNHQNFFLDPEFVDLFDGEINRSNLKPTKFNEMLKYAKSLSKDFDFIRVDFYEFEDKVLLGELTNYPVGGYKHMPIEVDKYLGDLWE